MSKNIINIQNIIEPEIIKLGYELEYIEYVKEGSQNIFRIVMDKKDSRLTTEDCEQVSRLVEEIVDKSMKTEENYILEVSSPGLERQLKNIGLYKKYMGLEVKLKLYKKINNTKEIIGILKNVDETKVVLKLINSDEELEIEFKDIACGNTVYDFGKEV